MGFVYLGLAIVLELLGTPFLKYTLGLLSCHLRW